MKEQQASTIARVIAAADSQQDAIGIAESARLLYTVEALSEEIEHVVPSRSSQIMAVAALGVAGAMVAVFAAAWWDARHKRYQFTAAGSRRRAEGVR